MIYGLPEVTPVASCEYCLLNDRIVVLLAFFICKNLKCEDNPKESIKFEILKAAL